MAVKIGIVGLPNVGKSSLYNALTCNQAEAANYPFCTIDPNVGVVEVPDQRLNKLNEIVTTEKVIPSFVHFVDIAGLVKNASQGEGLGNKFLGHIRETQAIAHVVRCFSDPDVIRVDESTDPISDIEIIETELLIADMQTIEKHIEKTKKVAKSGNKESIKYLNQLQALLDLFNANDVHRLDETLASIASDIGLISTKPIIYIANIDEDDSDPKLFEAVQRYAQSKNTIAIKICAKIESEIAKLDPEDQALFLQDLNMSEPGLNRVIQEGYKLLGLHNYFTVGPKEIRSWTIPVATNAQSAAGVIHTDFFKKFIRAEVISYANFIKYAGETEAKKQGVWCVEGKDYVVQDGDVIFFRIGK